MPCLASASVFSLRGGGTRLYARSVCFRQAGVVFQGGENAPCVNARTVQASERGVLESQLKRSRRAGCLARRDSCAQYNGTKNVHPAEKDKRRCRPVRCCFFTAIHTLAHDARGAPTPDTCMSLQTILLPQSGACCAHAKFHPRAWLAMFDVSHQLASIGCRGKRMLCVAANSCFQARCVRLTQ